MSYNAREERSAQRWRESVADECFEEGDGDEDEGDLNSDDTFDDEDSEDEEGKE